MEPTISNGSWVLINKVSYVLNKPSRNDIVLIKYKDNYYIKRIIAVENDTVEIKKGKVFINDNIIDENYVIHSDSLDFYKRVVPLHHVFVLGDNRRISKDSRYKDFGFVSNKNIVGKVIFKIGGW